MQFLGLRQVPPGQWTALSIAGSTIALHAPRHRPRSGPLPPTPRWWVRGSPANRRCQTSIYLAGQQLQRRHVMQPLVVGVVIWPSLGIWLLCRTIKPYHIVHLSIPSLIISCHRQQASVWTDILIVLTFSLRSLQLLLPCLPRQVYRSLAPSARWSQANPSMKQVILCRE